MIQNVPTIYEPHSAAGAERAYGKFIFPYAVEGPHAMPVQDGTVLETAFWASFTAGRGVAVVISRFCHPLILLLSDLVLNLVCGIFLASLAKSHEITLWVFTCFFGTVLSPLFPACLVWANFYVEITAKMTALAFVSAAGGAFVFSWLSGYLFQYHGPPSLMYLIAGYAGCAFLIFLVMFLVARKRGKRHMSVVQPADKEPKEDDVNADVELLKD